jgi:hypothetical protein
VGSNKNTVHTKQGSFRTSCSRSSFVYASELRLLPASGTRSVGPEEFVSVLSLDVAL